MLSPQTINSSKHKTHKYQAMSRRILTLKKLSDFSHRGALSQHITYIEKSTKCGETKRGKSSIQLGTLPEKKRRKNP
jgi:hypothetical protein